MDAIPEFIPQESGHLDALPTPHNLQPPRRQSFFKKLISPFAH